MFSESDRVNSFDTVHCYTSRRRRSGRCCSFFISTIKLIITKAPALYTIQAIKLIKTKAPALDTIQAVSDSTQ
jgi:hypothetical protein